MSNVDWAALEQLQQAGLSQADVEALGGAGGFTNAPTSTDASGLPQISPGQNLIPSLPPNATEAQKEQAAVAAYQASPQLQQQVTQQFGYIGAYFLTVPELQPIIIAAGLEGWGQGEFDAAIANTNWWKSTSQAQRNFQELQITNPGEASQQVSQMQDTILSEAQSLGVTIPSNQLSQLATSAVEFNWTPDVIQQTLRQGGSIGGPSIGGATEPQFGAAATFANQLHQLAGEYLQNLSGPQVQNLLQQNLQGKLTADGLQQEFSMQAAQQYPWMAKMIGMGVTPSQYLSTYASAAGKTLEVDPSSINWTDPKYMSALLQTAPDGSQQPVGTGQFQQNLMKNPVFGYQNTQGARDQDFAAAQQIATTFGAIKT